MSSFLQAKRPIAQLAAGVATVGAGHQPGPDDVPAESTYDAMQAVYDAVVSAPAPQYVPPREN